LLVPVGCGSLWDAYQDPVYSGSSGSGPSCYSDMNVVDDRHAMQCGGDAEGQLGKVPTSVEELSLCGSSLADARPLARLGELHRLSLYRVTGLADASALGALHRLDHLDLTGWSPPAPSAASFLFLQQLRGLRSLRLASTPIAELAPITGLLELETLDLTDTPVADLAPLARLTRLRRLSIHATNVTDLRPLAGLARLEELDLAVTGVTDLEPLRGLRALRHVGLERTFIYDLSPLRDLPLLRSLGVDGVPVSFAQKYALEQKVNRGRAEADRFVAHVAGHEHFSGACPLGGAPDAPLMR
jgi:hypothetical protein